METILNVIAQAGLWSAIALLAAGAFLCLREHFTAERERDAREAALMRLVRTHRSRRSPAPA